MPPPTAMAVTSYLWPIAPIPPPPFVNSMTESIGRCIWLIVCLSALWNTTALGQASDEPEPPTSKVAASSLASQIDRLVETVDGSHGDGQGISSTAAIADDDEFFRRLSLDLLGAVPTKAQRDAFRSDPSPNKRQEWISRLIADPLHREHLMQWLDVTLMERRTITVGARQAWLDYLRRVIDQRVSLKGLAAELLRADNLHASPPVVASRFALDRKGDPHLLTRDVGRLFFGVDYQCAQCHDHPLVDDYLQLDYQGLHAFFASSYLLELKTNNPARPTVPIYWEKPFGDAPYESVFVRGTFLRTGPRLPGERQQQTIYRRPDARLQSTAESPIVGQFFGESGLPPLPRDRRRERLLATMESPEHRQFARNWANRLWALVFGRGLVEPLDMHHSQNAPVGGPLLDVISQGLIDLDYQPTDFIEQLVRSKRYQRSHWTTNADPLARADAAAIHEAIRETLVGQRYQQQTLVELLKAQWAEATDDWVRVQQAVQGTIAQRDVAEADYSQKLQATLAAQQVTDAALAAYRDADRRRIRALFWQAALTVAASDADRAAAEADVAAQTAATEPLRQAWKTTNEAVAAAVTAQQASGEALDRAAASVVALESEAERSDQARRESRQRLQREEAALAAIERTVGESTTIGQAIAWRAKVGQSNSNQLAAEQALATAIAAREQATIAKQAADEQHGKLEQQRVAAQLAMQSMLQAQQTSQSAVEQFDVALQALASVKPMMPEPGRLDDAFAAIDQQRVAQQTAKDQAGQQASIATEHLKSMEQQVAAAAESVRVAQERWNASDAAVQSHQQQCDECTRALLADRQRGAGIEEAIATIDTQTLRVYPLRNLSPEQLAWSMLRATGILDQAIVAKQAIYDQEHPADEATQQHPDWQRQRSLLTARQATDELRGNVDLFVHLYGAGAGVPDGSFFATAEQFLFVANQGAVYAWGGSIAARVAEAKEPSDAARELYGSVLGREASAAEVDDVRACLEARPEERSRVAQELTWALMSSLEFRFYH
jgi:hypothetical protein